MWNNGSLTYSMKSQAVFVDTGVKPIGSTWARNPIPRVNDNNLGLAHPGIIKINNIMIHMY